MSDQNLLIVIVKNHMKLCKDNKWRDFTVYGTPNCCVKIYRNLACAVKKAKRINGQVAVVPGEMHLTTNDLVIEYVRVDEDTERVVHHQIGEFFIPMVADQQAV